MRAAVIGLMLLAVGAGPVWGQQWEVPIVNPHGDTMYTRLADVVEVAPKVYRAWSKYVYAKPTDGDVEALVQKDYDCENATRRVVSAVFYNANRIATWRSTEPGRWIPVTPEKGRGQWGAVCARVRWGGLAGLIIWLEQKLT